MIYTSYYARYKDDDGVSISRGIPGWFKGERCEELMPPWELVNAYKLSQINDEQYEEIYREVILKELDAKEIYEEYDGKVLLCYETPDKFCHRKIVAKWLNENGIKVKEL